MFSEIGIALLNLVGSCSGCAGLGKPGLLRQGQRHQRRSRPDPPLALIERGAVASLSSSRVLLQLPPTRRPAKGAKRLQRKPS